jgi:hypothetical protein
MELLTKKTEKIMFAKNKISQSMVDAVNKVLGEQPTVQEESLLNEAGAPIKEPTKTGMKVYGRSYGNSAKAKQDQTKSSVDNLKGPKTKELLQKDKEEHMKTKGKYDEAAKPDYLDFDKDGDKKEPMKSALATKKKMSEELKGDQHKIDKNKNKKIDSHDFAILRGEKKVKEEMTFKDKLIEAVRRSDIPAYLRKARGDAPLTPAEVKGPSKDAISHSQNLAKARNEEVEEIEEVKKPTGELKDACWKGYTAVGMKKKGGRQVPNCVPEEVDSEMVHEEKLDEYSMDDVRKDAASNLKKSIDKQSDARKNSPAKKGFFASVGQKQINMVKGAYHGLTKEEIELHEKEMTDAEMKDRERIVKGMKKGLTGFKARYGDRAKEVMYATATKQAMKEDAAEDDFPITTDTLAGRMPGGKTNSFKSYKVRLKPLDKEEMNMKIPELDVPEVSKAEKSIKAEATIAGLSGWKKVKKDVEDKSGAVHTPMSRARDLAQKAFKKVQDKTKIKD